MSPFLLSFDCTLQLRHTHDTTIHRWHSINSLVSLLLNLHYAWYLLLLRTLYTYPFILRHSFSLQKFAALGCAMCVDSTLWRIIQMSLINSGDVQFGIHFSDSCRAKHYQQQTAERTECQLVIWQKGKQNEENNDYSSKSTCLHINGRKRTNEREITTIRSFTTTTATAKRWIKSSWWVRLSLHKHIQRTLWPKRKEIFTGTHTRA